MNSEVVKIALENLDKKELLSLAQRGVKSLEEELIGMISSGVSRIVKKDLNSEKESKRKHAEFYESRYQELKTQLSKYGAWKNSYDEMWRE